MDRGFWIPCRGPPAIALTGKCHSQGKMDLWLSMLSACGQEEATVAHLLLEDNFLDNGDPCDSF